MSRIHRVIAAAALVALSSVAQAASITYTSSVAFVSRVAPGSYTENFDGMGNPPPGPVAFSGGAFAYSASAPSDIYLGGGFLGASQINEALTINFTSGNVTAIAANFFATDINDDFQAAGLQIDLSDGTSVIFSPPTAGDSFLGFVSDVTITSLTIQGPGPSLYAGLDNLLVGTAPEPGSLALVGLAMSGLLVARRRQA